MNSWVKDTDTDKKEGKRSAVFQSRFREAEAWWTMRWTVTGVIKEVMVTTAFIFARLLCLLLISFAFLLSLLDDLFLHVLRLMTGTHVCFR